MKKEVNPTVGIAVAAVVVIAIFVALYFKFLYQPPVDPKVLGESRAGISRTQERLRKAGIGGPGGPPMGTGGGPPNTAGAPSPR